MNALFVGGGTGGGKSTLARALCAQHGLRMFPIDAFWYDHARRAGETPPDLDVQWLEWSPATQAADFERISGLMFSFVLEDLAELPAQPAALVEGPQVTPDLLPADAQAIFLIPTPAFQERVLVQRPMPSSDPAKALSARLVKDRLYADRVAASARERGFPVIDVDGSRSAEEVRAHVEELFAETIRSSEPVDLAAVRRWENDKIARNIRSWIESGDERASADMTVALACECGHVGCAERVQIALTEYELRRREGARPGALSAHQRDRDGERGNEDRE